MQETMSTFEVWAIWGVLGISIIGLLYALLLRNQILKEDMGTEKMQEVLGERVKEVRITLRLTESPACLVADAHDMGGNLERLLKSAGQEVNHTKPILEINPHHPMVKGLNIDDERFSDWSNLLFDQALLAEGGQLDNPAVFVKRLNELLLLSK